MTEKHFVDDEKKWRMLYPFKDRKLLIMFIA
jgi:hypothetical protein